MRKIIKVRLDEEKATIFRGFVKEQQISQQRFLEEYILNTLKQKNKIEEAK